MRSKRRGWIALAGVAAAAATLALGWFVVAPELVRGRITAAATARGLEASVAGVGLGLEGVALRGVTLRRARTLTVRVDSLELDAGLVSLLFDGPSAVERVRARGVRVDLELEGDLDALVANLRPPATGRVEAGSQRSVEVSDLRIRVRDRRGLLLRTASGSARTVEGGGLRLALQGVELAPEEVDGARADRLELRLVREGGALRVDRLAVDGPRIHYQERGAEERSPLWGRLRQHAERAVDLTTALRAAEPRATPRGQDDAGATEDDDLLGWLVRATGVLSATASLAVEGLEVDVRSGREHRPVLERFEAEARVLGPGRFRLEGSGRPSSGGRLGWNLEVEPEHLRAEGSVDFQGVPLALIVAFIPPGPWHRPEDTRLTGELRIVGQGAARISLEGTVAVDDLAVSSSRIAPQPVREIAASLSGSAEWFPLTRRLEISRLDLAVGGAELQVVGSLEWPEEHYLIDLRATLPPTDCGAAVGAIPAGLLGDFRGFSLEGRLAGRVTARVDSRDLRATRLDLDVTDQCRFLGAPAAADVGRFAGPFLHRVVEPDGTVVQLETGPGSAQWTPIGEVSPFLVQAVLGHEDGGFFRHVGFATDAIRVALVRNLEAGRYAYGASTITMQLVKNVFLHREKTLARKVQEVLLTWWLESVMDKAHILELYLNVIEYGPGIYGVRAAAQHYFGRLPSELGPAEAAYLATILPSPKIFHSHWEDDVLPDAHRRRVARFLRILNERHRFDAQALAHGLASLEQFDFYHPGEALPVSHEGAGAAGSLPVTFGAASTEWEDAVGPDDTTGEAWDEEPPEDAIEAGPAD